MASLVWKDMLHHGRFWVWSLLVALTGGLFLGVALASWTSASAWAAQQPHADHLLGIARVVGSNLVSYTGLATAAVVSTTLGLTVSAQQRTHALWKVIGMPGRTVRRVILGQVAMVGLLGGLGGAALTGLAAPWYLRTWRDFEEFPADLPVHLPLWGHLVTLGLTTLFCILGGLGPALRAGRTPEMQSLRDAVQPASRIAIWQMVVAGVLLLGTLALPFGMAFDEEMKAELSQIPALETVLGGAVALMLTMAALVVPGWSLRPLLLGWTALVPSQGAAWFSARENARHRAGLSLTTIIPFAISVALTGVVYSMVGASNHQGAESSVNGFIAIAVPIFVVSAVGGVANIAMVGRTRAQESALLGVIGARPSTTFAATLYEGLIYATTGILFGLIATTVSAVLAMVLGGGGVGTLLAAFPWKLLLPLCVVSLLLAVGTTITPAVTAGRRPVMERLRQPL